MSFDKQIFASPERVKGYVKFLREKIKESEGDPVQREWKLILNKTLARIKYLKRTAWKS